jgi:carbon storage regulator CsrA
LFFCTVYNNAQDKKCRTLAISSYRPGESILIKIPAGQRIQVAVSGIKGNRVRVGIEAPTELVILREELAVRDFLV